MLNNNQVINQWTVIYVADIVVEDARCWQTSKARNGWGMHRKPENRIENKNSAREVKTNCCMTINDEDLSVTEWEYANTLSVYFNYHARPHDKT